MTRADAGDMCGTQRLVTHMLPQGCSQSNDSGDFQCRSRIIVRCEVPKRNQDREARCTCSDCRHRVVLPIANAKVNTCLGNFFDDAFNAMPTLASYYLLIAMAEVDSGAYGSRKNPDHGVLELS